MGKVFFVIAVFLLATAAQSQKQTKEKFDKIGYIIPPSDYSLAEFKKYLMYVKVPSGEANLSHYIENKVDMGLFERTKLKEEADFKIQFTLHSIVYHAERVKAIPKVEDKDGVKRKYNMYEAYASYSFHLGVRITLRDGREHYVDNINGSGTYTTGEYQSDAQARQFFHSGKSKFSQKIIGDASKTMSTVMGDKFAHIQRRRTVELISIKPKKFDYEGFNKATKICGEAVEIYNIDNRPTDEMITKCVEAIELWKTELLTSDLDNKKARINKKVTAALYYNIGIAYFLMKDYEKSYSNFKSAKDLLTVTGLHLRWAKTAEKIYLRLANKG